MPYAYNESLRKQVMAFLQEGLLHVQVAAHFSVSPSTVSRWAKAARKTGNLAARRQGRKVGDSRVETQALLRYMRTNSHQSLAEIGGHFGVSRTTISKRLKQVGYPISTKRGRPREG
jgi:transposase